MQYNKNSKRQFRNRNIRKEKKNESFGRGQKTPLAFGGGDDPGGEGPFQSHGNAGGALLNMSGQLTGIISARYSETAEDGTSCAIPVDDLYSIVNNLP